jgi:hypothetical protein
MLDRRELEIVTASMDLANVLLAQAEEAIDTASDAASSGRGAPAGDRIRRTPTRDLSHSASAHDPERPPTAERNSASVTPAGISPLRCQSITSRVPRTEHSCRTLP